MNIPKVILASLLALVAFAANSIITRLALETTQIDEASFVTLRLVSGAICLWCYVLIKKVDGIHKSGKWLSALALFIYAISFTYGYGFISAGSGALILFGSVQITMTISGYIEGERLTLLQWCGFAMAIIGLTILMLPGISAPSLVGTLLMSIAGVAWAIYTLQGRTSKQPKISTAGNFIKAVPMVLLFWCVVNYASIHTITVDILGFTYALISGVVTSAMGYIVWYAVLPYLKASQAAVIQLSVPVLVTFSGVIFLNEMITLRISIASVAILLGTLLVLVFARHHNAANSLRIMNQKT
jgi:drug/metabolite transporter (DMT)-like permease